MSAATAPVASPASSASASSPAAAASSSSSSADSIAPPPVPAGHGQLYVKNLSFSSTDASLLAFVEAKLSSKPHSVHIVTRRSGGRSRGFGFVTLVQSAIAGAIEKLNGLELEGRTLAVVEAKPRDPNAPRQRQERPPRQPRQPRKPRSNEGEAASSSSSSSSSSPTERKLPERKSFPDATQLYVNNLAFSTKKEEVAALFTSKLGVAPLDVDIVEFKFGRFQGNSRGFGFVFVPNNVVDKALALDKTTLGDREIGVARAKTAEEAAATPRRPRRPRRRVPRDGEDSNDAGDSNSNDNAGDAPADNRRRRSDGNGEARGRGRRRRGGRGRGGRGGNGNAVTA